MTSATLGKRGTSPYHGTASAFAETTETKRSCVAHSIQMLPTYGLPQSERHSRRSDRAWLCQIIATESLLASGPDGYELEHTKNVRVSDLIVCVAASLGHGPQGRSTPSESQVEGLVAQTGTKDFPPRGFSPSFRA